MQPESKLPWARYAIEFVILFLGVFLAFLSDGYRKGNQESEPSTRLDAVALCNE